MTAPISATAPQFSHRPRAMVTSKAKSSRRSPAAAFPSSFRSCSSISTSCRTETLGPDLFRRVAYGDEAVGDRLDEARRAADERDAFAARIRHLTQDLLVDAACIPRPARRLFPRERVVELELGVRGGAPIELVAVDHVLERARRVEQAGRDDGSGGRSVPEHGDQRDDARPAPDEEEGAALLRLPHEIPADRAAQLQLVSDDEFFCEVRGDLAVVEALDRDGQALVFRSGGDRVAPLCLVAVLGGQAHVDVLAGPMAGPVRDFQNEGLHAGGLVDQFGDLAELPRNWAQSPQYRCSRHGSPYMWYPSDSQNPGSSSSSSLRPRTHFALFQKERCGTSRRAGPPCAGASGAPSKL